MTRADLEKLDDDQLEQIVEHCEDILQRRVDAERTRIVLGIKKGLIDFKNSKTLMDFLSK